MSARRTRKSRAASRRRAKTSAAGFTLIEVLAVVLVTSLLLGATINFYINLTREAAHASENVREVRRASALLDRIAVDLEHTVLVTETGFEVMTLSAGSPALPAFVTTSTPVSRAPCGAPVIAWTSGRILHRVLC